MQAVDRREHAELHPAGRELVIAKAFHVPADVVAPPAVADVRRGRRETRLERERLPRHDRITRETHGVTVRAGARKPRERERALDRPLAAREMLVVEHPQRVHALNARIRARLPVNPPKIRPLILEPLVQYIEVGVHELIVVHVERDGGAIGGLAERLAHRLIRILECAHAIGRVNVEGHAKAALVQFLEETLRIREKVTIPRVPRPARTVLRVHVGEVPVHVDHRHRERNILRAERIHELEVALLAIAVVARPPVAERELRHDRLRATNREIILHRGHVVAARCEHEKIDAAFLGSAGAQATVGIKHHRARIINLCIPHRRVHARLERDLAVGDIERTGRTAEVPVKRALCLPVQGQLAIRGKRQILPVPPHRVIRRNPALDLNLEAVRRERAAIVFEVKILRFDREAALVLANRVLGRIKHHVTIDREGRRAILERAARRILEAHHARRDRRDPKVLADEFSGKGNIRHEVSSSRASPAWTHPLSLRAGSGPMPCDFMKKPERAAPGWGPQPWIFHRE